MADFQIAIIGAGPAGLSAAARAQILDQQNQVSTPSYVLLEGFEVVAKTIQRYQKGKKVMAEPGFLDLRSDVRFEEGRREEILGWWQGRCEELGINIRYQAEVSAITGSKGAFDIALVNGENISAENIILGIGLEGNPRMLGVDGERLDRVQYNLEDPKAFHDEIILVVGAGDSAIENALALSEQNDVFILNRRDEFSRAKEGNLNLILKAISDDGHRLNCFYSTSIKSVTQNSEGKPLHVVMKTPEGDITMDCDRIVARLGAIPPRRFVESIGIQFPSERRDAIPELSRHYESNVPGVYIVGSLAGYPLIKQAMNQGYDVVEFINGNFIKPADYPLLQHQLLGLPYDREVDELLERFQALIPMFRKLNSLAFRELIIESTIIAGYPSDQVLDDARRKINTLASKLRAEGRNPRMTKVIAEGDVIYDRGEFGTSFFTIVDGEVVLENEVEGQQLRTTLGRGEFFGESSLLSGRPRGEKAIAGSNCIVVETPRRTMLKLMNSNEEVRSGIDWIFVVRELQRHFAPFAPLRELRDLGARVGTRQFDAGATIYDEGDEAASLFIVRSGAITLSRQVDGQDVLVSQLRSGKLFGQMALMGDGIRRETATATVAAEVIEVERAEFLELVQRNDARIRQLQEDVSRQVIDKARMSVRPDAAGLFRFLMRNGLGEATNVLVIDERLCVGCDNCEKACAETHEGLCRLDRKSGPTAVDVHIPSACRHCEQPHCMKDCPPNAILRAASGEVFITDACIGCGNCEKNCPYDVIRLSYAAPKKPGLLSWLLFGRGSGPGERQGFEPDAEAKARGKKAVKCDACVNVKGGPACVRACPTGAAKRIGPAEFVALVEGRMQ